MPMYLYVSDGKLRLLRLLTIHFLDSSFCYFHFSCCLWCSDLFTIYLTLWFAQGRHILHTILYTDSSMHPCIKPAPSDKEEQAHIGSKLQSLTPHFTSLLCDSIVPLLHFYCVES